MNKTASILVVAAIILSFALGYFYCYSLQNYPKPPSAAAAAANQMQPTQSGPAVFTPASAESSATINLVAVDSNGNGVSMPLTVEKRAGYGETLIDINNLVFWFDTQQSIQTARDVAQNLTGIGAGSINLVYTIGANASVVEGPSAGAALTIATIAALENKPLAPGVMITGTVNSDGTIGQVGGILEKASAAKRAGAKLFLVPKREGSETRLKPVETCSDLDSFKYCTTKYVQTTTDISETAGIGVKEVSTIAEAEKYFFA